MSPVAHCCSGTSGRSSFSIFLIQSLRICIDLSLSTIVVIDVTCLHSCRIQRRSISRRGVRALSLSLSLSFVDQSRAIGFMEFARVTRSSSAIEICDGNNGSAFSIDRSSSFFPPFISFTFACSYSCSSLSLSLFSISSIERIV